MDDWSRCCLVLMVRYKIQDIRTLVGHKTDLAQVKVRPAVRLEKGDD